MTMSPLIEAEYRRGLRELLLAHGRAVDIVERERAAWPDSPSFWANTYGWENSEARLHCSSAPEGARQPERYGSCSWVLPEGISVEEVTYSQFTDTYSGNDDEVGINAYGGPEGSPSEIHCACGKYRGVTLRYQSSLQEALMGILGLTRTAITV